MANYEIDFMEYSSDANAQAAYVTNAVNTIIQQETTANDIDTLGDNGGIEYRLAEKLVLSESNNIAQVKLTFSANAGSPSGDITCRIETDNSGVPSGTLAHANATLAITVTPSTENTWSFANFVLSAGTYWVVWICADQSTNNAWQPSMNYGVGGGRGARSADGVWGALTDRNRTCKIYVLPLQSYSEATIKTQGSYALKAVATTDALNKTLTHTFDPPLDLSGKASFSFDMRASRIGANVKVGLHDTGGTTTELTPTINSANEYETKTLDISAVADADKNNIDTLTVTVVNADA